MPSADQVPVKSPHSTMHWHMWVVLIAGSTGSALRAVRSSNLHITPDARRGIRQVFVDAQAGRHPRSNGMRQAPEIKESSRAKGGSASRGLVSEAERIGLWVELLLTG